MSYRTIVLLLLLLVTSCQREVDRRETQGVVTAITRSRLCGTWIITINHGQEFSIENITARDVLSMKNKKVRVIYNNNKSCFSKQAIEIAYE